MKKLNVILFLIVAFFMSCVEEFKLQSNETSFTPDVVIHGNIASNGESTFYLSKTQPLGSEEPTEYIQNAEITIVGQDGFESPKAVFDTEKNCYIIHTENLPLNTSYSVLIKAEGETYQSEFQELLTTPDIKAVTYKERTGGISVHVSSDGNETTSPYYFWSYEEDWEFHAPVNFIGLNGIPYYSSHFYPYEIKNGHNPYLICWNHNTSKHINIYSTTTLTENKVKDVELLRIPVEDARISYIYSILVKQYSINEKAYMHYRLSKQYTEESSGLFAPMPTEIKGNVSCVSTPAKKAHGYILASDCKTKRIFIYESDFKTIFSEYSPGCIYEKMANLDVSMLSIWQYRISQEGAVAMTANGYMEPHLNPDYLETMFYTRECVDCRAIKGATKKRPDFWPNNHE